MKKILNEWRKFVLSERETDEIYTLIVDVIINNIKQYPENLYFLIDYKNPNWELYFPNEVNSNTWKQNFLFGFTPASDEATEYLLQRIIEVDPSLQEKIKIEENFLRELVSRFRIAFVNSEERPEAGADMSPSGQLRFFLRLPQEHWNPEYALFKQRAFEKLQEVMTGQRDFIEHELTHWINATRSKFKPIRTSGDGKNTIHTFNPQKDGGKWYANSTEEFQARLIPIYIELKKRLLEEDLEIVSLLKKNGIDFVKSLLKTKKEKSQQVFGDDLYIKDFDEKDLLKMRPDSNQKTLLRPAKLKKLIQRLLEMREQLQQYLK